MKRLAIPALLIAAAEALAYEMDDSGSLDAYAPRYDGSLAPAPATDRYFGGGYESPVVAVPVSPGSGPSYISNSQVMTDRRYCYRSVVDGALVCHGH